MHRWLLVPFPALAAIMGWAYILGSPVRTQTPSFVAARSIVPLQDWGLLFLVGAAVLTLGLVLSDVLLSWALIVGGGIYTWWAVLFAASALTDEKASLTGWAVHGTVAWWHFVAAWWIRRTVA